MLACVDVEPLRDALAGRGLFSEVFTDVELERVLTRSGGDVEIAAAWIDAQRAGRPEMIPPRDAPDDVI
jgi:hypothetical protein